MFSALSRKADLARCLGARGCPLPAVDAGFAVPKTIVIDLDDSDSDCESEGGTDEEDVEQCTAGKVNSAAGPGDG